MPTATDTVFGVLTGQPMSGWKTLGVTGGNAYVLGDGVLFRVPISAGSQMVVASDPSMSSAGPLAVTTSDAYYAVSQGTGMIDQIALSGGMVVGANGTVQGPQIVSDAAKSRVFFWFAGSIIALSSGGPPQMASGAPTQGVGLLAVDATDVPYFVAPGSGGSFYAYSGKPGATAQPVVQLGTSAPSSLAVDTVYLYWNDSRGLVRAPKDGTGTAKVLDAAGRLLVATDTGVYWEDPGGLVLRQAAGEACPTPVAVSSHDFSTTQAGTPLVVYDANGIYGVTKQGQLFSLPR
jgi:hypothetical protein